MLGENYGEDTGRPRRLALTVGWGMLLAAWAAAGVAACSGESFGGCEATRTCALPDGGAAGEAGALGAAGSGARADGDAGAASGGAAGMPSEMPPPEAKPCDGECSAEACCDGVCVDLDSALEHCGRCGHACSLPNAQAVCDAGECRVSACSKGQLDCNEEAADGCESSDLGKPKAPSLLRPRIGAFTGSLHARTAIDSLKPHFAWQPVAPAGCGKVSYQLQVDAECELGHHQDCAFESPEIDLAGLEQPEFTPEEDLPVEETRVPLGTRYYWRVRACDELERCSDWSDVRYVEVGRLREDITGDGYADIVAVSNESDAYEIVIYPGAANFGRDASGAPEDVLPARSPDELRVFGRIPAPPYPQPRFLGDLNGDGFNDFGVDGPTSSESGEDEQTFYLYLGGRDPAVDIDLVELVTSRVGSSNLYSAGDFDADGFADVILTSAGYGTISRPLFYRGSADFGSDSLPTEELTAPFGYSEELYGQTWAAGDFNGDGRVDLALTLSADEKVQLLYGATEREFQQDAELDYIDCAPSRLEAFDVDADGRDELAASCSGKDLIVYMDTGDGMQPSTFSGSSSGYDFAAGDIDADGYADLLMADARALPGSGILAQEAAFVETVAPPMVPSSSSVALADHDGDGWLDLVVGGAWYHGDGSFQPSQRASLMLPGGDELYPYSLAH